jgi:hypothetical protein
VFGKLTGYISAPDGKDGKSIVQIAEVGAYRDKELLSFNKDRWDADSYLIAAAPQMAEYIKERADAGDERAAELWGIANGSA